MGLIVSELYSYPLKSVAGISVNRAQLDSFGVQQDRRWMLVDDEGVFVSQRKYSQLALIKTELLPKGICFSNDKISPSTLKVDFPSAQQSCRSVQVWSDICLAQYAGEEAASWFSKYLSKSVRLVYMPTSTLRQVDLDYAQQGERVSFADGFPLLLTTQGSLDELNRRLDQPITMQRFRPNLVVSGCEGFAEDQWRRIRIGDIEFRISKPCERCVMTTVDPITGQKGKEPLATLSQFRRFDNKVMFGQNLVHLNQGSISVGDTVEILE
ncbi:MAG: MOSC domain-containing protein [Motiliproteus sp.]|nr:MOSC domain-containing protein [Motiliproteus sp.]MCW9051098.1 MOSC domain-containing protein [Motiliproteus sp.]